MQRNVINLSPSQMMDIIEDNPESVFILFTHVNRDSWFHPDYLIRRALSLRYMHYGVTMRNAFSHCGTVWYDTKDKESYYWHQTYPFFAKDHFNFRKYNIIYQVDDPSTIRFARAKCKSLYEKKKPYGVGRLVAFAFTLWFSWLDNPIRAGKVCSQAVAVSYPSLIKTDPYETDPQLASIELDKHPLKKYRVDLT